MEHDLGAFREGETLVLTLKDKGERGGGLILGGQGGDTRPVMPPGDMKKGTSHTPPRGMQGGDMGLVTTPKGTRGL